jgi:hypothetical protein
VPAVQVVAGADPLVDALPRKRLHRRFEADAPAALLDREVGLDRVPELQPLAHRHGHGDPLKPGPDGGRKQADAVLDFDPVFREGCGETIVPPVRERPVHPGVDDLTPQVPGNPEEGFPRVVRHDQNVGVGPELVPVHDRDGDGHAERLCGGGAAVAPRASSPCSASSP